MSGNFGLAAGAKGNARDYYSELLQSTSGGEQSLRPENVYAKSYLARLSE